MAGADGGPPGEPDAAWRSSLYPAGWTPAFTDDAGRFVHDFSYAGFARGEREPTAPARVLRVENDGGDMTPGVQAALDEASRDGGVVLLASGDWRIDGQLVVRGSNVVLRGEGATTRLRFTKSFGIDSTSHVQLGAPPRFEGEWPLTLDAQPRELAVQVGPGDAGAVQAGDEVALGHVITAEFIAAHGMTGVWRAFNGTWQPFEWRTVVSVSNGVVTLDVPVRSPLLLRDRASLRKVTGLVREVGVESLSLSDTIDPGAAYLLTQVHLVGLTGVVDGFVRDVRSFSDDGGAQLQSGGVMVLMSKRVTVSESTMGRAQHRGGGGNGYLFEVRQSSDVLFRDCQGHDGRHNFIQNWGFGTTGVVWLRVTSERGFATATPGGTQGGVGYSEFHHSLATANLVDSSRFDDGFSIVNRGAESTGAGHTGTQNVLWNTSGTGLVRSMQWGWGAVVGTTGIAVALDEFFIADGTKPLDLAEGLDAGATLEPQSLYEDQRRRRLGR